MARVSVFTLLQKSDKNMGAVNARIREMALELVKRSYHQGLNVVITDGFRSYEVLHNDGISHFETRNLEIANKRFNNKVQRMFHSLSKDGHLLNRKSGFIAFSEFGTNDAKQFLESFGFDIEFEHIDSVKTTCGLILNVDGWMEHY